MKFFDYVNDAQINLRRAKLRTSLTVTALIIGTFTLAMTTAFTQGLSAYLNTQLHAYGQADIITVAAGSQSVPTSSAGVPEYQPSHETSQVSHGKGGATVVVSLNQSDINAVKSVAGIKDAYAAYSSLNINYVSLGNSTKYIIQAAPIVPGETMALAAGVFPATGAAGIVLPFPYVETFGAANASDLVGKTLTLNVPNQLGTASKNYSVPVTGVLPDTVHQPGAMLDYTTLTDMVKYQSGSTASFDTILAVTNPGVDKAGRATIKSALVAKGYGATTYDDQLAEFSRPLTIVSLGLAGFAGIALLAAMIGIVNTLLMAVFERIQEIGLLKAMGMRRRGIFFQFLIEAGSIGFWGGVIGVALAQLLGRILNRILLKTVFAGFAGKQILSYPAGYMIGIIALATVIGLIAGAFPAWRASRLSPIDALRRE